MARYDHWYEGISARPESPRGMDPNYRDGYRGMRMQGGPSQAEYGWYRMRHQDDLGFRRGSPVRGYGDDYELTPVRYDPESGRIGGGGVHGRRYDGPYHGGADRQLGPGPVPGYRFRYSNRGLTGGGYSDAWAFGPMRGSRD
jgi:hypothetical protein